MEIELEEFFIDFVEAVKPFVPESDHVEMYIKILQNLHDSGYIIQVLRGHNEEIDEAISEIIDDINEFEEDL